MSLKESDFHGPYIDPKSGFQYENFGSWFAREAPLNNEHNAHVDATIAKGEFLKRLNKHFDDLFDTVVYRTLCATAVAPKPGPGSSAAGSGAARPVQAPADPVHAPDQPAVSRWVGP